MAAAGKNSPPWNSSLSSIPGKKILNQISTLSSLLINVPSLGAGKDIGVNLFETLRGHKRITIILFTVPKHAKSQPCPGHYIMFIMIYT